MRYAAMTTVGNVRRENQDSVVVGRTLCVGADRVLIEGDLVPAPGGALVAVVDGMGGHRGGQNASAAIGCYLLDRAWLRPDAVGPNGEHRATSVPDEAGNARAVLEMLTTGNGLLYEEMSRRPELRAMGATIAGLACFPGVTVLFNLGDARAYHYAAGYLQRISEDHRAPAGTVLQSLGGTAERVAIAPFVQTIAHVRGSRWLLCSDGLSDFVSFLDLQEALAQDEPVDIVRGLVAAALEAGGTDNVSVVVLDT